MPNNERLSEVAAALPTNMGRRAVLRLIGLGGAGIVAEACGLFSSSPSTSPATAPTTAPATAATAGIKDIPSASPAATSCDVMAITSLTARPDANVNGIPVRLQVRDTNDCTRGLFYNETGIAKGTEYDVNLPSGWSILTASLTVAVTREGGKEKDYTETPELIIKGPFKGIVGVYEGSFRVLPNEWVKPVSEFVLPIQRGETKKPTLPITVYTD